MDLDLEPKDNRVYRTADICEFFPTETRGTILPNDTRLIIVSH